MTKKAPPLSRKQKIRIRQILASGEKRGKTVSEVMFEMGNLRGKSNIGQYRRFLERNAYKRSVKTAKGNSLYVEKEIWEQGRLL